MVHSILSFLFLSLQRIYIAGKWTLSLRCIYHNIWICGSLKSVGFAHRARFYFAYIISKARWIWLCAFCVQNVKNNTRCWFSFFYSVWILYCTLSVTVMHVLCLHARTIQFFVYRLQILDIRVNFPIVMNVFQTNRWRFWPHLDDHVLCLLLIHLLVVWIIMFFQLALLLCMSWFCTSFYLNACWHIRCLPGHYS